MKAKLEQDRKRRKLVKNFEEERNALKAIIQNSKLKDEDRLEALISLQNLPRNSSPTRVKNRCLLTGRSRGVQRDFKVSRHMLRKKAMEGFLPGIKKAS